MKKLLLKFVLLVAVFALPLTAMAAKNILIFGDSLSAGYGIAIENSWANLLQHELQRTHPQYRVVNTSISGETTAGGRVRINQALREHQPAIVILELGANDGLRGTPIGTTRANLAYIIRQCLSARAKVLLLGMRLPPNYGEPYATQFHTLFTSLAQQYHTALLPFMLEGIAADQFQADNLHPAAVAQPLILRNIMQPLKPLLSQGGDSHGQSSHTRDQSLSTATRQQPGGLACMEPGSATPGARAGQTHPAFHRLLGLSLVPCDGA